MSEFEGIYHVESFDDHFRIGSVCKGEFVISIEIEFGEFLLPIGCCPQVQICEVQNAFISAIFIDRVGAATAYSPKDIGILAVSAVEGVIALAALQGVGSCSAVADGTPSAVEYIVSRAALQRVCACAAFDRVALAIACKGIVARATDDVAHIGNFDRLCGAAV